MYDDDSVWHVQPWIEYGAEDHTAYTMALTNGRHEHGYLLSLIPRKSGFAGSAQYWTVARYTVSPDSTTGGNEAEPYQFLTSTENVLTERFLDPVLMFGAIQAWLPPFPYLPMLTELEKLVIKLDEKCALSPSDFLLLNHALALHVSLPLSWS